MFLIAKILGSKGLKGHLKVHAFTQDPFFLAQCPEVWNEYATQQFVFSKVGWAKMPHIVELKCEGIDSREAADAVQGMSLYTVQKHLPALQEDEYYWQELQGYTVQDGDNVIGKILELDNFGTATDIVNIQCTPSGVHVQLPFHKHFIQNVDREAQTVWCTKVAAEWIQQEGQ
jgi:16S rRNA processing protein RimM